MNFIEAIEITRDVAASNWRTADADERTAIDDVADLIAEYDALEPDWTDGPERATHYIIHANGKAEWCRVMPGRQAEPIRNGNQWNYQYIHWTEPFALVDIPVGIDWRLCIWQRPEAQP
jgi:hypothetical protein